MKQTNYPPLLLSFFLLSIAVRGFVTGGQSLAQTVPGCPAISAQPASQAADYGSDVSFSVTATGATPLSFQWQKNGVSLVDYDNVAGSQKSTLNLVGVAANDIGNYNVIVASLGNGSITSSVAALTLNPSPVFNDTFENGLTNWNPLFDSDGLTASTTQNHTSGGSWSLEMTGSSQKMYHNLPVQYACRVRFSFWFYDDGQSQRSCGGELRGYSGLGYRKYAPPPGGLRQLIAIGRYNAPFPTNNTQSLDTTKYQCRILHGTNAGWFNLNAARAPGWHNFCVDRAASGSNGGEVDFYVDGTEALAVTGVKMSPVDSIFLGSLDTRATNNATTSTSGEAYFDDVTVNTFPGLFDWQNLASSGPIPDWMQLRETGTNSQVINASTATVFSLYGAATNSSLGDWGSDGAAVYSIGMRGYLDYTVSVHANGAYRIEVEGRERAYRMPALDMPLEISIDGEFLGRVNLAYGPQSNGLLHCFTPFVQAGSHTIRLYWDNADPRRSLLVQAVRLQSLVSPADINGTLPAWVANRLAAQNGIEVCPPTSLVSPACIEGRGQYLRMMNLQTSAQGDFSTVPVHHGAGNRWYANVPLSASNSTTLVASYQNGGSSETNEITWQATNLLLATNNNSLTIRKGDSLLFSCVPDPATNGEVIITIGTNTSLASDALNPAPFQFTQAGTFPVTGTYVPTGTSGSIIVTVVDASFDSSPIARLFHARYWECMDLPPQIVLDPDPRLKLVLVSDVERSQRTPALPPKGANERDFRVYTRSSEPEYILARLGTNGPVLANIPVRGFRWFGASDTYLRIIGSNPDGSQLIETAFVAAPQFPSLSAEVEIISSGVTFEDGTVETALAAKDFDATGICRLRFIRAAGAKGNACHTTKLYDNGEQIGWH